jgi:transcriptional regulator GlxA family with amidase domain
MHTVAVLALDDVIAFDLATPIEVFGRTRLRGGEPGYRVVIAGPEHRISAGPMSIDVANGLDALRTADTVIVPGLNDPTRPLRADVEAALRGAHESGARIASICVGAFTLAATGLLDGRRATTHWRGAEQLAALHPEITVDPAVLFVDDGDVLTSAGATAGIDLCLHMIRSDYGAAVAADAARSAVHPITREGGQAQFIVREAHGESASLRPTLHWIEENAHRPLTLHEIAARARVSTRTLNRRFHEETGMTPLEWLTGARVRHAQALLETTQHPVELVAQQTGFGSAANLRGKFRAVVGTSPASYRASFASR